MTHIVGTVQNLMPHLIIGPDSGISPNQPNTWNHNFSHNPAPNGTKFLLLHFRNVNLPENNRLEIDLGYDMDVFTSDDGDEFWTRPINIYVLSDSLVPIRYITDGSSTGSVQIDMYGRGEQHEGEEGHSSISNCDPFLKDSSYAEPTYDPFWYCKDPPNWENLSCVSSTEDIRTIVGRSVGMIITVHNKDAIGMILSTCSVTLIDTDKVITAGHCVNPEEALTSSVIFNYQTDCEGNRPLGYNPHFYKVKAILQYRFEESIDYSLLQLATSPIGIPPIQLRHDLPYVGEQIFGIHHPNGAVKKLSIPHPSFATVTASTANGVLVPLNFHVSGGSSGSGLFDTAGRIVGVLANGDPCNDDKNLLYYPTASFIQDTVPTPPAPITRDVMMVLDRSGSMSTNDDTGRKKIEVARDATSLFVQLIMSGTGNRLGMVSFSTTASLPPELEITNVTEDIKEILIGPAPYSGGKVGSIVPHGSTSIGDGLETAHLQFPVKKTNPRSILLLTDGLENTPPMIEEIKGSFNDIIVHAIGFGTEADLDGDLLTMLTNESNGLYLRAGNGLTLEKFFSHAFGNIFENGILIDPDFDLLENQPSGVPLTFRICDEETITAVIGWDRSDSSLLIEITTPNGVKIYANSSDIVSVTGRTWTFLRVDLPYNGEREGLWNVRVFRPGNVAAISTFALRYFINIIPKGGPRLSRLADRRVYYTGDSINPLVILRYANGSWPEPAKVHAVMSYPNDGTGNILSRNDKLQLPKVVNGDTILSRHVTLKSIEDRLGKPLVNYTDESIELLDDAKNTDGRFEPGGIFGRILSDKLVNEGNYTFHVKAIYGKDCTSTRELIWSTSVAIGIDSDKTIVKTIFLGIRPDDRKYYQMILIPRDKYGNNLGPGRVDCFKVQSLPGNVIETEVVDIGDGSYQMDISLDPDSSGPPQIGLEQQERPMIFIKDSSLALDNAHYVYSILFICGEQKEECCNCTSHLPGRYSTSISIHNFHDREINITKQILPITLIGAVFERKKDTIITSVIDKINLKARTTTMQDCCNIIERLIGVKSTGLLPITTGFLEISSPVELNVTAVYTTSDLRSGAVNTEVKYIDAKERKNH